MNNEDSEDSGEEQYQGYISIPYGPQVTAEYVHSSKHCDFQDVIYNSKTYDYIILDSRGISSWHPTCITSTIKRAMEFEAYKFNVLRCLCYSRFHNLYFALTKHFGINVYNLNFLEICHQDGDGDSISRLLYNDKENELIAICRNKIKFLKYVMKEMKPSIAFQREFKVEESLVLSSAKFDEDLQRIYLMCDTDIFCYSLDGKELFCLRGPNSIAYFCACAYSDEANLMVAGSINGELSIYSPNGGLVTAMLSHSKIITSLLIHPKDGTMFISASLDGTIKVFSLQMLGEIYSIPVFTEGILFMKVYSTNSLFAASHKGIQTFDLNYSFRFWSTSRAPVKHMNVTSPIAGLRQYVVVSTADNSIRLFSKHTGQRRTTILPPPEIPIGDDVISVAFDRQGRVIYILFKPLQLWIYSTRTDPATRVATWDLDQTIKQSREDQFKHLPDDGNHGHSRFGASSQSQKQAEANITCCSLTTIKREVFNTDSLSDQDLFNFGFLLCGLSNGLICFLDPCQRGLIVKSLKAHPTSPVVNLRVDYLSTVTYLLAVIDTINGIMVRIWNVVTLECCHQMFFFEDFTQFVFKNLQIVVGYSTGHIHTETIFQNDVDKETHKMLKSNPMKEHDGHIVSLDLSDTRQIFCSVGSDNYVRVWNLSKVLLVEIKFDNTLKYALFLSHLDEILISFKSQLFVIPYHIVFQRQQLPTFNTTCDDSSGDESFIFEDPFVCKRNMLQSNNPPINLASYLVPYPHLGLETLWMFNKALVDPIPNEEIDVDLIVASELSSDSLDSFASTTLYQDSDESQEIDVVDIQFPSCLSTPEPLHSKQPPVEPLKNDVAEVIDAKSNIDVAGSIQTHGGLAKPTSPAPLSYYDKIRNKQTSLPSKPISNEKEQTLNIMKPYPFASIERKDIYKITPRAKKKTKRKSKTNKTKSKPTKSASVTGKSNSKTSSEVAPSTSSTFLKESNIRQSEKKQTSNELLEGKCIDLKIKDSSSVTQTSSSASDESKSRTTSNQRSLLSMALGKQTDDTALVSYRNVLDSLVNPESDRSDIEGTRPSSVKFNPFVAELSSGDESLISDTSDAELKALRFNDGASTASRSSQRTISSSRKTHSLNINADSETYFTSVILNLRQSKAQKQNQNLRANSQQSTTQQKIQHLRTKSQQSETQQQNQNSRANSQQSTTQQKIQHLRANSQQSTTQQKIQHLRVNSQQSETQQQSQHLRANSQQSETQEQNQNLRANYQQSTTQQKIQHLRANYQQSETQQYNQDLEAKFQPSKAQQQNQNPQAKFLQSKSQQQNRDLLTKAQRLQDKSKITKPESPIKLTREKKYSTNTENEVIKVEIRPSQTDLHINDEETNESRHIVERQRDMKNSRNSGRSSRSSQDPEILDPLMISPVRGTDPNNKEESPLIIKDEETQRVMKYILSSFRKPASPIRNKRSQFRTELAENTRDPESDYASAGDYESSTSRPFSVEFSLLSLRPVSGVSTIPDSPSKQFSPVSRVVVRCSSTEPDSDDSSTSTNTTSLKDRLKRYRKSKQKQRERAESVRNRKSVMSGYESASIGSLHQSHYRTRTPRKKDRLTIKQRPVSNCNNSTLNNVRQRDSEAVYFDDYLNRTVYRQHPPPQSINKKETLIENLEKKLSGQKHRYHTLKSDYQMQADRLALSILKNNNDVKVPVSRSSSSIPNRPRYQLVNTNATSTNNLF
ncbi:uncharacterized protein [Clytia hemisphaerica]